MRNCQDIQELLSFYIDDCLEPAEKAQLEEHLQECSQCQEELEALKKTINMFASLDEELIPPASFRRELREKLEKEQKDKKIGFSEKLINFFNRASYRAWIPLAAAAVLLIVVLPVIINGIGPLGLQSAKEEAQKSMEFNEADNSFDAAVKHPAGDRAQSEILLDKAQVAEAPKMKADEQSKAFRRESSDNLIGIERKIIRTGNLSLEVDNYRVTTAQINTLVQEMQGYIANENTHIYDRQRQLLAGNMSIRIPQERFAEALNRLEGMGKATNRSVDGQDVTEEYVDVQSRLKAMRLKEERLLAILNKSGTLGDVLAVENELARTRAELEALEGRLRYLNNRTELSTINISIRETLTPIKKIKTTGLEGVLARTREAFIKSINSIIIGIGNLIVYIGSYLPFIILGIIPLPVAVIVLRKIINKYGKR